jgi:hypothetical protein
MSEVVQQTLWEKLRYTPARDFIRGKLSTRLDLRRPLEEASLPLPVKELLHRVVRSTRLWRLEQVAVMQELIAHFGDGITAGNSPDELIKKFGDEAEAARLIRRAKRRNRPWTWHVLRMATWSAALLLVFYMGYAVYFFAGSPSPRVNYVASINQAVQKTPQGDRAWPLYRQALLQLRWTETRPQLMFDVSPGSKGWPAASLFVSEHQQEVEWVRQAAARPSFGFLIGVNGSLNDPELWPSLTLPSVDPDQAESLTHAMVPPLSSLRALAGLLSADATVARQVRDGKRALLDIHSLLGLSRQLGENATLLAGLASLSIYEKALDQIELTLREDPSLISREDWLALARRLSGPKVAGDVISFKMERMSFEDILQRSFTDDGSGNGRLTAAGFDLFIRGPGQQPVWAKIMEPAAGLVLASRQKLQTEYNRLADRAAANLMLPMRDTDWHTDQDQSLLRKDPSLVLVWLATPSYWRSQATAERTLGRRDGVLVGIALELHRRQYGDYPQNLNALTPSPLPAVPADRISGEPLRYRIVDGRAVVYSVGADRKDGGGTASQTPLAAALWETRTEPAPPGDWLVYPTLGQH